MFSRLFATFAAALVAGVMLAATAPLHAQSPAPYPKPDLDIRVAGEAYASVLLADGSVVIGGVFSQVNGVPRNNIVRLTPSGQVDMQWNPDIQGSVRVLAVDSSGRVYVGGSFTSVGGAEPEKPGAAVLQRCGGGGSHLASGAQRDGVRARDQ